MDLRFALRALARNPLFTLAAVLALALGIGANTAIFSIINGILVHPSGVQDPGNIVAIRVKYDKLNLKSIGTSAVDFQDTLNNKRLFSSAATATIGDYSYTGGAQPERLIGAEVSWQWFDVFGARPRLGRAFRPEEDVPGANQVVVLFDATWRRLFGSDPNVIGRTIELNRKPHRIIGVMGPEFAFPIPSDFWIPIALPPERFASNQRHNQWLFTLARLRPGVTPQQADSGVRLMASQIAQRESGEGFANPSGWGMFAVPILQFIGGDFRTPARILQAAVLFVLLIACSNIAGLLLARASARSREIAIRASLGAGRWRLVRQMLTESLLLAIAGGLAGLALGAGAVRLLFRYSPIEQISSLNIPIDLYVLGFTCLISLLAGLLFGLAPAWQMLRARHLEALKEGGRSGGAGLHRQRLRSALVIGEFSMALVLLVGAGLIVRSLANMQDINPGFQPRGVMTAMASLSATEPSDDNAELSRQITFHRAAIAKFTHLPGVESAAAAIPLPFSGNNRSGSFQIEGRQDAPGEPGPHGHNRAVSPAYFSTMGISILRGRAFTESDREGAEPVAIVDELLARQYWPKEDPVGKRLRRGNRPWATIVGLVRTIRHDSLVGEMNKGTYYFPLFQVGSSSAAYIVKTAVNPASLALPMRAAVSAIDPAQPLYDLKTMDQRLELSLGPRRFAVFLLGLFASLALLLAALGIYGVISYSVAQRTQEIGIRMALGAGRARLLRLVLGGGLRLAVIGAAIGLIVSAALARMLEAQLFQVSGIDPLTFALTTMILVAVALLACYLPARRATRVDVMEALRYE